MTTKETGDRSRGRGGLALVPSGEVPRYSEAEFLIGGTRSTNGELKKISFKVHEGYAAEAWQIWHEKKFPYPYLSDLARHAFVRHIKWLASLEQWEHSVLHELAQIDEIVGHEEMKLRFAKSIEAYGPMVNDLLEMPNGISEVGRVLRRIKARIDMMHAGFWRDHYMRLFLQRFAPYLQAGIILLTKGAPGNGSEDEDGVWGGGGGDIESELTQIVGWRK